MLVPHFLSQQWSTTHPAVFASVDGIGRVDLWNINAGTEVSACCGIFDAFHTARSL